MFRPTGVANFDKYLDKATSNLLLEVDLFSVLAICDLIRQKDCPAKYAIAAIKKKLAHQNPHVVFYALQTLESIVKNCGSLIHDEVANKEFMEYLRDLAKSTPHENVRDKILELIQAWAHAFRKLPTYRAVQDCVNIMKAEGCKFPPLIEADAMFCADTAPEWQDGGCCNRCRVEFGIMNRKHHCRACGQIFCAKCSSKQATLPKFGIEKEVRVCDSCFEKYGKRHPKSKSKKGEKSSSVAQADSDDNLQAAIAASLQEYHGIGPKNIAHSQTQQPRSKTEEELQEEEQLQLAIAISQSEAEAKEREKSKGTGSYNSSSASANSTPTSSDRDSEKGGFVDKNSSGPKRSSMAGKSSFEQEDPELARYLDRSYWEQRHGHTKEENLREETGTNLHNKSPSPFQPSAPVKEENSKMKPIEIGGFVESLRGQIEIFVNRMRSNSSRGRHISNDTSVQTLFMNITALHSQLLNFIKAQEDWRSYYEGLQEKLNQIHDARDALDALRKEHFDRLRIQAEEAERQRQIQLQVKLNYMRQQKHHYLQQQQEIALRKVQEEEKMMQMRIDQQRMGYSSGGYPPGYMGLPPGQIPPQMPPGMMMQPPPQQHDPQQMHYMPQHHGFPPPQGPPTNSMMGQPQQPPPHSYAPSPYHQQPNSYMGHPDMQQTGHMQIPPPGSAQNHHLPGHHIPGQGPPQMQHQNQIPHGHIPQGQMSLGQNQQQGPMPLGPVPQGQMPLGPQIPLGPPNQQGQMPHVQSQQQGQMTPGQNQQQIPPVHQHHMSSVSSPQLSQVPSMHQVQSPQQFYQPQQQQQPHNNYNNTAPSPQEAPRQPPPSEPSVAELISFD